MPQTHLSIALSMGHRWEPVPRSGFAWLSGMTSFAYDASHGTQTPTRNGPGLRHTLVLAAIRK
jgi:hypothetical protein